MSDLQLSEPHPNASIALSRLMAVDDRLLSLLENRVQRVFTGNSGEAENSGHGAAGAREFWRL